MFFVQPMVDHRHVWIRGVGIQTLSLDVIEVEFLIIIFRGYGKGFSNIGTFLGLKGFESFEVIIFNKVHVIEIVKEVWIFLEVYVHSLEGVVEVSFLSSTSKELEEIVLETILDLITVVLHFIFVYAHRIISRTQTYSKFCK